MSRFVLVVAALCAPLLVCKPARAQWVALSSGNASVYLNSISTPDGTNIFVAGDDIDQSGTFPTIHPRIYASSDGGKTFTDISGSLGTQSGLNQATAVAFADSMHGWVAVGSSIYATTDRGGQWTAATVSGLTNEIHAFDTQHAVRVGKGISTTSNGGQSWTASTVAAGGDTFQRTSWSDAMNGWASAAQLDSNGFSSRTDVFGTTNGGTSWTALGSVTKVAAGPLFFLADGQTGWLATYAQQEDSSTQGADPNDAIAHLMKTTDGGKTFTDTNLPTVVGQIQVPGFSANPLHTALLHAMFWTDASHGHLVGTAYQGSETSSMSGGMVSTSQSTDSWKLIDYQTSDGQTWSYTQLGTITGSLTGLPPSDGTFTDGLFIDFGNGWLSAYQDTVWAYGAPCNTSADCPLGYNCVDGHCSANRAGGTTGADGGTSGEEGDGGSFSVPKGGKGSAKPPCACDNFSTAAGVPLLCAMLAARRRRARR